MSTANRFLFQAIELARKNVRNGGRPFGAVIVMNDVVIAQGVNEVLENAGSNRSCRAFGDSRREQRAWHGEAGGLHHLRQRPSLPDVFVGHAPLGYPRSGLRLLH